MAMLRYALLAAALVASALGETHLTEAEEEVLRKEQKARSVAAKQAASFHHQVAELNHNVLPSEQPQERWHKAAKPEIHGPVHWQWQVKTKQWVAVPKTYKHPKGAKALTHEKAVKMQHVINKAVKHHVALSQHHMPEHHMAKKQQHFIRKASAAEQAVDELKSFEKVNEEAFPTETGHKKAQQTAEQMEKAREAEVDAAMPARFQKQVAMEHGQHKAMEHGIMSAQRMQKKMMGARAYRMREVKNEVTEHIAQTAEERHAATKAGDAYLKHVEKLNDAVFPLSEGEKEAKAKAAEKAKAEAKAEAAEKKEQAEAKAAKKAAWKKRRAAWKEHHAEIVAARAAKAAAWKKHMIELEHKRAAAHKPQHNAHHPATQKNKGMPPSSDVEPNPAGTDQVYLGAPQGGYAKGDKHHTPASKQQHAKAH